MRAFVLLLVISACLVTVPSSGCRSASYAGPSSDLLESATAAYLAGDYDSAVREYTDFLGSQPRSAEASQAYLGRGNAYYGLGRWRLAQADFENARSITRDRAVRARATLGLAHALFAQESYEEAQGVYMEVLRVHRGHVPQDEASYRLGISLARRAQWQDASDYLREVVSRWPQGEFARLARAKLPCVAQGRFTVQVGAFTDRRLAERRLEELRAGGFEAEMAEIDMDGTTGYAARSGRLSTWAEARSHAARLESAGFSTYLLP